MKKINPTTTDKDWFLGIDLGTSGIRMAVLDRQHQCLAQVRQPYSAASQNTAAIKGWHQQQAKDWWQLIETLFLQLRQNINLKNIRAIAVDGTSATLLACDEMGTPLTEAILYCDLRARKQAHYLQQHSHYQGISSADSSLAKILWIQQHPEFIRSGSHKKMRFFHQADWVCGKLLGKFEYTDFNNALKMGFDAVKKQWHQHLQQILDIDLLPQVVMPGSYLGTIDSQWCQRFGFHRQTAIVAGTTDSTAAIIASGAEDFADGITSFGSSLVVKLIHDQPIFDGQYGIYSQPLGSKWLVGGASNCGLAILKQFFSEKQIRTYSQMLDFSKATGLHYYPLIGKGERFPLSDPDCVPLLTPRPKDNLVFFQAILESLTRVEQQCYAKLQEYGCRAERIFTMGGGTNNRLWMQYRQQQLQSTVIVPKQTEAACGVAILAASSMGDKS